MSGSLSLWKMKAAAFCGFNHAGEVITLADQLHVDPEEFRALLNSRITHYVEAIGNLEEEQPDVDAGAFGEGFADRAADIAAAVNRVHAQSRRRLQARVGQFEEMLHLVADVDTADSETAVGLSRHV